MKLRTIIVDDESLARRGLRLRLQKFPDVEIVAECQNGREALLAVSELQADLLFLDIQMPGMDGFEVVRRLQGDDMPMVVFVTAFDHYALEAFEVHALDYVLKPVDEERLALSVERVRERLLQRHVETEKQRLLDFVAGLTGVSAGKIEQLAREGGEGGERSGASQRLVIKDGAVIHRLPYQEIEWIDAAGDYMCIHAAGETHITRSTMKELEAALEGYQFARIHRSTLVNVDRVDKIVPLENGKFQICLRGGQKLTMSRSYREQLAQFH